jgi:hypothetical protein
MAQHRLAKTRAVTKPINSDPQQQFQEHWATIDKLQRNIAAKQQRQDEVLARFRQDVLPIEHQFIQSLYDKTTRLLSFADKKSLGKYDREALLAWIEDELDELSNHPFNEQVDLDALRQQFFALNKVRDVEPTQDEIERFRLYVEELYGSDGQLSDAELIEMMADPEKMITVLRRLFGNEESTLDENENGEGYGDDDNDDDADYDDDDANGGGTDQTLGNAQRTLDSLLKSPEVHKMYKKLANILHPDREPDPAKKQEKHLLMVQLSKAKKSHDVWTILEMYHRYWDPAFQFNQAEIPAINALMQHRINTLTAQLAESENPHSLSGMIWAKFGGKTTKSIDNKFRKHIEQLQQMIEEQTQQRNQLRSLAVLKRYLSPLRAQLDFDRDMDEFY